MEIRGLAAVCRTSPPRAIQNSEVMRPYLRHTIGTETAQLSRQPRDCSRYLLPRYFGASPKTSSIRFRVQHRHFLTPSSIPKVSGPWRCNDRNNFCKPTRSKQLLLAETSASHETETETTTHTVYTLPRADSCNRYCESGRSTPAGDDKYPRQVRSGHYSY
jgi:hypothetical protein